MKLYHMVFLTFGANTFNPGFGIDLKGLFVDILRQRMLLTKFH